MALGRERAVQAQAPHNLPHLASAAGGGLEAVAGDTVYEVGEKVDGGAIILQRAVLVKRRWTYRDLWREALFPLGVELVPKTLRLIEGGQVQRAPQDESLATWEPPTDQNLL
ncbi:MAG: hypothetical protein J1D88_04820 [Treponema sp.]|nr:hypothetical protein [Treponema sp.]